MRGLSASLTVLVNRRSTLSGVTLARPNFLRGISLRRKLTKDTGHGLPAKAKVVRNVHMPKPEVIALGDAFGYVEQERGHSFLG